MTQPATVRRVTIIIETDDYRVTVTGREPIVRWNIQTEQVSIGMGGFMYGVPLADSRHVSLELAPANHPLDVTYEALGSPGLAAAARPSPGEVSGPSAGEGRGALPDTSGGLRGIGQFPSADALASGG